MSTCIPSIAALMTSAWPVFHIYRYASQSCTQVVCPSIHEWYAYHKKWSGHFLPLSIQKCILKYIIGTLFPQLMWPYGTTTTTNQPLNFAFIAFIAGRRTKADAAALDAGGMAPKRNTAAPAAEAAAKQAKPGGRGGARTGSGPKLNVGRRPSGRTEADTGQHCRPPRPAQQEGAGCRAASCGGRALHHVAVRASLADGQLAAAYAHDHLRARQGVGGSAEDSRRGDCRGVAHTEREGALRVGHVARGGARGAGHAAWRGGGGGEGAGGGGGAGRGGHGGDDEGVNEEGEVDNLKAGG
eukprot:1499345-Prymnesium_polylepis.1